MSPGAAAVRPRVPSGRLRAWSSAAAVAACLAVLVPPFAGLARRFDYAASLQFSVLAIVVPGLLATGAPWRRVRLARRPGTGGPGAATGILDRLADRRLRHPELVRTVAFIVLDLLAVVLWRTPGAVAAVARDGWLGPVEGSCLVVVGTGLWLELIASPPLVPRSGHLRRAILAAIVMWVFWIDAYVVGLSNSDWYTNFRHVAGRGLSAAADQQIGAACLWFVAAVMLVPVIFWNALQWIHSEEDPDAELFRLTKMDRRTSPPGLPSAGPTVTPHLRPEGQPFACVSAGMSGRGRRVSKMRSAAPSSALALRRSAASRRSSTERLPSALASVGFVIKVWTSSIARRASEVVHRVAVATRSPISLPAGEPGTSMLVRS